MEDQGKGFEVVGEKERGGVGVLIPAGVERARVSTGKPMREQMIV